MTKQETTMPQHSPSVLKHLFRVRGIIPNKRFGQNFLIDNNNLITIPEIAQLTENDIVLEVGTGSGGLTRLLAERSLHVITVEVDKKLFELSTDILSLYKNVTLIHADVLKTKHIFNPDVLSQVDDCLKKHENARLKVVSNLPYNISTPVIITLLESALPIKLMVLMLQKEITDRMAASPGTREYGILSIIIQLFSEVEVVKTLSPQVFWPKPEVNSAIVRITVNKEKYAGRITDYPFFVKVVSAIFNSRRKTLLNSLQQLALPNASKECVKTTLKNMQLSDRIRGEALNVDQIISIAEAIRGTL